MDNILTEEFLEITKEKNGKKMFFASLKVLLILLFFIVSLMFYAARWYISIYGATGFDSILFTLFSNMTGVEPEIVKTLVIGTVIPAVLQTAAASVLLFVRFKNAKAIHIKNICSLIIIFLLSVYFFVDAGIKSNLFNYMYKIIEQTKIYEEKYVSPDSVNIEFPAKKKNLIYIFLESVETTFMSENVGGALPKNVIKELYDLAKVNVNFSHNDGVGGFLTPQGTTWTVAALVGQTSGIPLKASPGVLANNEYGKEAFLPGAVTMMDILGKNGYNQAFIIGSDGSYANRNVYFKDHSTENIYDLFCAREDGVVAEDYYEWWGMEDKYLFRYAKEKILELSKEKEPFCVNILTVDTHFPDGYKCSMCKENYQEQYSNVLSCSSRQVLDFVNWVKRQRFYKNTTIIIAGDHLTMDNAYIERNVDNEYDRRVYNCIINSSVKSDNYKNRQFTSLDMFPTALASIGCEIEGERLGLGTNLFSNKPTYVEEMGYLEFDRQISMSSNYYIKNFMVGK